MSLFNRNKKVFISEFTTSCQKITNNGQQVRKYNTCTCRLSFKFDGAQSFPETAIKGAMSLNVTLSAKYRYMYSTVQESKNATKKPNLSGTTRKDCPRLWGCPWSWRDIWKDFINLIKCRCRRLFGDCWNYRSKQIDCKRYSFTLRPRRKDSWKTVRWRQP